MRKNKFARRMIVNISYIIIALMLSIVIVNIVSAENIVLDFLRSSGQSTSGNDPIQSSGIFDFYNRYQSLIDFFIMFALFCSVAMLGLKKAGMGEGGGNAMKALAIAVGAALALAALKAGVSPSFFVPFVKNFLFLIIFFVIFLVIKKNLTENAIVAFILALVLTWVAFNVFNLVLEGNENKFDLANVFKWMAGSPTRTAPVTEKAAEGEKPSKQTGAKPGAKTVLQEPALPTYAIKDQEIEIRITPLPILINNKISQFTPSIDTTTTIIKQVGTLTYKASITANQATKVEISWESDLRNSQVDSKNINKGRDSIETEFTLPINADTALRQHHVTLVVNNNEYRWNFDLMEQVQAAGQATQAGQAKPGATGQPGTAGQTAQIPQADPYAGMTLDQKIDAFLNAIK